MKRAVDFVCAMVGTVVLSPVLLLVALAVKLTSPGTVIFRQQRIGIHGKRFEIYKFRTMRADTPSDVPTHLLVEPEGHVTGVGRFLRRTSLDELPQMFNILKGDMSIVGPRPALWNQFDLIEEREKFGANDVRPGLTGWAQVHGRDELSIAEKAALDGYYVRNKGPLLDMRCIGSTIVAVVKADGVVEGAARATGDPAGEAGPTGTSELLTSGGSDRGE